MKNAMRFFLLAIVIGIFLNGCSGGSSSGDETPQTQDETPQTQAESTQTGVFLDSAVEGVKYKTSSGLEGYTNSKGEYEYKSGDKVEFLIGDISLGEVKASELVSVLQLPNKEEVSMLLQSLDTDLNPSNGINISRETIKKFNNSNITLSSVSLDNKTFTDKFKDLTNKTFNVDRQNALKHAKQSMQLENIKKFSPSLYQFYAGNFDFSIEDKFGKIYNEDKFKSSSSKRLNLYYYRDFIFPSIQFEYANIYHKQQNTQQAYEATKKFLEVTSFSVGEIIALAQTDATSLSEHIGQREADYVKNIVINGGLQANEDNFKKAPNLLTASQIALYREFKLAESCKDIYVKPKTNKVSQIASCASSLVFESVNIFNDGYQAFQFYSTTKEWNTLQLVNAYLKEYFNAAGDITFMYNRFGVSKEEDFLNKLKEETLVPSTVFWADGDYNVDMDLFKEKRDALKLEVFSKVNTMIRDYGLKVNLDIADSTLIPNITKSKYNIDSNSISICYSIENNSYLTLSNISLNVNAEDKDSNPLFTKNIKIKDITNPTITNEKCINIKLDNQLDISNSNYFTIYAKLNYKSNNIAYHNSIQKIIYLSESNIFDLLKKVAPPTIILYIEKESSDNDNLLVNTTDSYVDPSQGTLSFQWKQIDIDDYKIQISNANSLNPEIYLPKLPNGISKKEIYIALKAIASISKKETIRTVKVSVNSSLVSDIQYPTPFAGNDIQSNIGESVSFHGLNTNSNYDRDDSNLFYIWLDENKEIVSYEKDFTKVFNKAGTYTYTLQLSDYDSDIVKSDAINIIVKNITNNKPTATPQTISTSKNIQKSITLSGSDDDNDTLTYKVISNPTHGTLSGTAPNLTYTPTADYTGDDSFTFKVNDGKNDSNVSTINITILDDNPINLSQGLVAHYEFEGNANDSSGNGNNGTEYGGVEFADGIIGQAGSFDGVDDYILVPNSSTFPTNAITLSYWINRDSIPSQLDNYISKELSFQSYLKSDGNFESGLWKGSAGQWSGYLADSNITNNLNKWILYTVTFDNDSKEAKSFINGVLVNATTKTDINAYLRDSSNPMYIGRNGSQSVYFINSKLDDLRIYNRALNESEIKELYKMGQKEETINLSDGLVAHYEFNNGFTNSINNVDDSSKWKHSQDVNIQDGYLKLVNNYDNDPKRSVNITLNTLGVNKLVIEKKVKLTAKDNYTLSSTYFTANSNDEKIYILYNNYHYNNGDLSNTILNENTEHFYIDNRWNYKDNPNNFSYKVSDLFQPIWGEWFYEKIVIDYIQNNINYSVSKDGVNFDTVSIRSMTFEQDSNTTFDLSAGDWASGSEHTIDYLKIYKE